MRRQEAGRHVLGLKGVSNSAGVGVRWAIKGNSPQRWASSQVVPSDSNVGSGLQTVTNGSSLPGSEIFKQWWLG